MKRAKIAFRYGLFAVIATAVNIGLQRAVFAAVHGPLVLYAAIGAGTAAGIVVKYLLDCRFIFSFVNRPSVGSLITFSLYVLMSGITTLVFWGTELVFNAVSSAEGAKYLGGLVGLALGYTLKYHLDKRFVFSRSTT